MQNIQFYKHTYKRLSSIFVMNVIFLRNTLINRLGTALNDCEFLNFSNNVSFVISVPRHLAVGSVITC